MVSFGIFLPKTCLFAVRWHNSWFSRLLGDDMSDIHVPGWGWGLFCTLFHPLFQFPVPVRSAILTVLVWYRTFRIFHPNFQKLMQRPLPDVLSSPGRSLSSSTNERGRSHLGCHYPVIQWYCCNMLRQESKWKSLPKNMLLAKNMSFCQPTGFLGFQTHWALALDYS